MPTNRDDRLAGDPRRDASDSARGYIYQLWRTVYHWLDLTSTQVIYIEGAEDIDIVSDHSGRAIQVKDVRRPLSLNNQRAIEAINNFWDLLLRNTGNGQEVRYEFITTAGTAQEREPLGDDHGLALWMLCHSAAEDVAINIARKIQTFLAGRNDTTPKLRKYLKDSSTKDVLEQFIRRVSWHFNEPDLEALRDRVIVKIFDLIKDSGADISDAEAVANKLYTQVVRALIDKTALTYVSVASTLEDGKKARVPHAELAQLRDIRLQSIERAFSGQQIVPVSITQNHYEPPILPEGLLQRRNILNEVHTRLASGCVVIHGATGMGKSILVRQAVGLDAKNALWSSLREIQAELLPLITQELRQACRNITSPIVVLDDFNFDKYRQFETHLGALKADITKVRGCLIFISYNPIGQRLSALLGIGGQDQYAVPHFDESEIVKMLNEQGCPTERQTNLARVIQTHTYGHPQLVAARTAVLRQNGFPKPSAEDLLKTPPEISTAQAEARRIIEHALDVPARDLLARCSIHIGKFDRPRALEISDISPNIDRAGEVLDRLIGPWLERSGRGHHTVSPLASSLGRDTMSPREYKRFNSEIANLIVKQRSMDTDSFSAGLLHALHGENEFALAILVRGFEVAETNLQKFLAIRVSWVTGVGADKDSEFSIQGTFARGFFRLFQWDIAALAVPERAGDIERVIEEEKPLQFTPEAAGIRAMYLAKRLVQYRSNLTPEQIVDCLVELESLNGIVLAEERRLRATGAELPMGSPNIDLPNLFVTSVVSKIRSADSLFRLASSLDGLTVEQRAHLLSGYHSDDAELRILFANVFIGMKPGSDGEVEFALLQKVSALSEKWENIHWRRASSRAIAAFVDDIHHDGIGAEAILQNAINSLGSSNALQDQVAAIRFNRRDFSSALEIWSRILPGWDANRSFRDIQPMYSARLAAIAAAELKQWNRAADYFSMAAEYSKVINKEIITLGLKSDMAFAQSQSGQGNTALENLVSVIQALEKHEINVSNQDAFAVHKCTSHILLYLGISDEFTNMPRPGMASNPDIRSGLLDLPPTPPDYIWQSVMGYARKVGNKEIRALAAERLVKSRFSFPRLSGVHYFLDKAISEGDLRPVANMATELARLYDFMEDQRKADSYVPTLATLPAGDFPIKYATVEHMVLGAVTQARITAKCSNLDMKTIVLDWLESEAAKVRDVRAVLTGTLECLDMPLSTLEAAAIRPDRTFIGHILASTELLGRDDTSPQEVLYAHLNLLNYWSNRNMRHMGLGFRRLEELIRKDWERFIKMPFYLSMPSTHIPAIEEELRKDLIGLPSIAKLLLAALPTTKLNVARDMREAIAEIAASPPDENDPLHLP